MAILNYHLASKLARVCVQPEINQIKKVADELYKDENKRPAVKTLLMFNERLEKWQEEFDRIAASWEHEYNPNTLKTFLISDCITRQSTYVATTVYALNRRGIYDSTCDTRFSYDLYDDGRAKEVYPKTIKQLDKWIKNVMRQ